MTPKLHLHRLTVLGVPVRIYRRSKTPPDAEERATLRGLVRRLKRTRDLVELVIRPKRRTR